jgi:hypothetical protein
MLDAYAQDFAYLQERNIKDRKAGLENRSITPLLENVSAIHLGPGSSCCSNTNGGDNLNILRQQLERHNQRGVQQFQHTRFSDQGIGKRDAEVLNQDIVM